MQLALTLHDPRVQIYDERNGGKLFQNLSDYNAFLEQEHAFNHDPLEFEVKYAPTIANNNSMCDLGTPAYMYEKFVKKNSEFNPNGENKIEDYPLFSVVEHRPVIEVQGKCPAK